jgi:hypothetical protein
VLFAVADGVTFVIAVVGALTGCASAGVAVVGAWKDRPRLKVTLHTQTSMQLPPHVMVRVLNDSPRATTVREVGLFEGERDLEITSQSGELVGTTRGEMTFKLAPEDPVFLEAGKLGEWVRPLASFPRTFHSYKPLRAYAMDARGRRVWGGAGPVIRMMVGDNPPIESDDPPELMEMFAVPQKRYLPAKVEPRWKLWVRKELRKPEAYRRWPGDEV